MTPYDRQAFVRSLILGSTLCLLVFGVMVATDDSQTTLAQRLGRLFALAPLVGALGAIAANTQAAIRGETMAMACLGASPARTYFGSSLAVACLGAVGAVGISIGWGDIDGLLPHVGGTTWVSLSDGGWASADRVIQIDAYGMPSIHPLGAHPPVPRSVTPVVACVIWMTVVLADWTTERVGKWARLVAAVTAGGTGVVLFHMLAAERVTAWAILAIPLPILLQTWGLRGYRSRLRSRRFL